MRLLSVSQVPSVVLKQDWGIDMYRNAVQYRGQWLAPGSTAFDLYHDKDPAKRRQLDQHLKAIEEKEKKLLGG